MHFCYFKTSKRSFLRVICQHFLLGGSAPFHPHHLAHKFARRSPFFQRFDPPFSRSWIHPCILYIKILLGVKKNVLLDTSVVFDIFNLWIKEIYIFALTFWSQNFKLQLIQTMIKTFLHTFKKCIFNISFSVIMLFYLKFKI